MRRFRYVLEEEFVTFLAQGADLLNSCPLVGGTGENLYQALTPNHFLLGRVETGMVQKFSNTSSLLGAKYSQLENAVEKLWARFWFLQFELCEVRGRSKMDPTTENLRREIERLQVELAA